MRFLIQRVKEASVTVDKEVIGAIKQGFLVFVGICRGDNEEIADKMIKKLLGLRIFTDEQGKTNISLAEVGGSLLIVSQFTLYADCKKGNRPSFTEAAPPDMAEELYEYIISCCRSHTSVFTGSFGADMKVELINDGPFTILLDDKEL